MPADRVRAGRGRFEDAAPPPGRPRKTGVGAPPGISSARLTVPAWRRLWTVLAFLQGQVRLAGHLRVHDLRHTSATLLLGQGVHPRIVQERLGHADIAMTLNRYSHVTPDMQRLAADTLDAAFRDVG